MARTIADYPPQLNELWERYKTGRACVPSQPVLEIYSGNPHLTGAAW